MLRITEKSHVRGLGDLQQLLVGRDGTWGHGLALLPGIAVLSSADARIAALGFNSGQQVLLSSAIHKLALLHLLKGSVF